MKQYKCPLSEGEICIHPKVDGDDVECNGFISDEECEKRINQFEE